VAFFSVRILPVAIPIFGELLFVFDIGDTSNVLFAKKLSIKIVFSAASLGERMSVFDNLDASECFFPIEFSIRSIFVTVLLRVRNTLARGDSASLCNKFSVLHTSDSELDVDTKLLEKTFRNDTQRDRNWPPKRGVSYLFQKPRKPGVLPLRQAQN
jgi:hypothetical protein